MNLSLRPATMDDADLLLRWRNAPEVRRWSRSTEPILENQHRQWLAVTLASPTKRLYVAEIVRPDAFGFDLGFRIAVGTGRLDVLGDKVELSLTVAPEHRGRGYGGAIVRALVQEARALGYEQLRAYVKMGNIVSLKTFLLADFEPIDPEAFVILKHNETVST